ncbi:hypothetical protein [Actinomycetospora aeridis]|uniref:Uncharacterized protein n=1 Tax=Actinomycetospora aeridis TaxID=3129231 RepID=A0ABU8MZR5_9PSEU
MTDLPYERTHPRAFAWTDKAFDLLQSGELRGEVHRRAGLETAVVAGSCPRCTHQFRFETSRDAVVTGGGGTLATRDVVTDDGEFVPIDVSCRCEGTHDGRLETEHGCGILFRIEVRPDTHDG